MATELPENWVRLACLECDREDHDFLTPARLAELEGWEGITQVQSYADAIKTYDRPDDAPPGFCALDWYTHLGICPDCAEVYRSRGELP
jgi:hypothetical protein